MSTTINLDTIILYVKDVRNLKDFYVTNFNLVVVEDDHNVWVLLKAGHGHLGLHRMGAAYQKQVESPSLNSNAKIVFEVSEDITDIRARFVGRQIKMREIKTFDDYAYWLCDGEDPEGNVFQLKKKK